jgi:Ca2+-binding EF-hand superfamily protein
LGLANEGITKEEMINKVIETGNEEFDLNSYFEDVDINSDGIISKNELEMLKDGIIELDKALEEVYGAKSLRSEEEIIEKTNLFFKNADQNSNDELDLAESEAFFKNYIEYELINQVTNSFNKQDRNQDGILNEKDMLTEEEMLATVNFLTLWDWFLDQDKYKLMRSEICKNLFGFEVPFSTKTTFEK